MLEIVIPGREWLDERDNTFISYKDTTLTLEHSLLSISKWEAKWRKPFFDPTKGEKSFEEMIDYIRCMTINKGVNPMVYNGITASIYKEIQDYIGDSMTATTVTTHKNSSKRPSRGSREAITSELIYYWMFSNGIPLECQKWHISRLMTLIQVCMIKGQPPKKMSKTEIAKQNAALNAARRAKYHTKG